ncbi:MAG: phosphate ABC transporter substrate-binding protein, partial [Gammaproteobacteria bacterium]|nr:phosphate ABC transporter substrate-binding protein [Gammaproteobacteria bacterium]
AVVVSKDVWDGGVRSISTESLKSIYENKLTNWQELGGPNRRIIFFNKEPGRGTWEVFVHWLYGNSSKAPNIYHPEVGANAEVRTKVSRTPGAISYVSVEWADQKSIFPLGLITETSEAVQPMLEAMASGAYPLSRSLILVTDGAAEEETEILIDFMRSQEGQALVSKHGYQPLGQP